LRVAKYVGERLDDRGVLVPPLLIEKAGGGHAFN
jgi:hypothetical protein